MLHHRVLGLFHTRDELIVFKWLMLFHGAKYHYYVWLEQEPGTRCYHLQWFLHRDSKFMVLPLWIECHHCHNNILNGIQQSNVSPLLRGLVVFPVSGWYPLQVWYLFLDILHFPRFKKDSEEQNNLLKLEPGWMDAKTCKSCWARISMQNFLLADHPLIFPAAILIPQWGLNDLLLWQGFLSVYQYFQRQRGRGCWWYSYVALCQQAVARWCASCLLPFCLVIVVAHNAPLYTPLVVSHNRMKWLGGSPIRSMVGSS